MEVDRARSTRTVSIDAGTAGGDRTALTQKTLSLADAGELTARAVGLVEAALSLGVVEALPPDLRHTLGLPSTDRRKPWSPSEWILGVGNERYPELLQPPFMPVGSDVVIQCP